VVTARSAQPEPPMRRHISHHLAALAPAATGSVEEERPALPPL
jgi:hypothetical protein